MAVRPTSTLLNVFLSVLLLTCLCRSSNGLAAERSTPPLNLFDRFRAECPADVGCIRQFDASLVQDKDDVNNDDDATWVAVYRSSNNMPSVMMKDNFLHAMRSAVDAASSPSAPNEEDASLFESAVSSQTPVAVARLRKASTDDDTRVHILDSIQCLLEKSKMDPDCDGGSEHCAALGTAMDALLLHHLTTHDKNHFLIRSKATLIAGPLLEARGFVPVQTLSADMATHVSSVDDSLQAYSVRSTAALLDPTARQTALKLVSYLGRLDREAHLQLEDEQRKQQEASNDDYDPWANSGIL